MIVRTNENHLYFNVAIVTHFQFVRCYSAEFTPSGQAWTIYICHFIYKMAVRDSNIGDEVVITLLQGLLLLPHDILHGAMASLFIGLWVQLDCSRESFLGVCKTYVLELKLGVKGWTRLVFQFELRKWVLCIEVLTKKFAEVVVDWSLLDSNFLTNSSASRHASNKRRRLYVDLRERATFKVLNSLQLRFNEMTSFLGLGVPQWSKESVRMTLKLGSELRRKICSFSMSYNKAIARSYSLRLCSLHLLF